MPALRRRRPVECQVPPAEEDARLMLGVGDKVASHTLDRVTNERQAGECGDERGHVEVRGNLPSQESPAREGDLFEAGLGERLTEGRRRVFFVVYVPGNAELVFDGMDGSPSIASMSCKRAIGLQTASLTAPEHVPAQMVSVAPPPHQDPRWLHSRTSATISRCRSTSPERYLPHRLSDCISINNSPTRRFAVSQGKSCSTTAAAWR